MTKRERTEFASDGLVQLHWQSQKDSQKTEFVAQGGVFSTIDAMYEWIRIAMVRHSGECPKDWIPMVCDSTSVHFLKDKVST